MGSSRAEPNAKADVPSGAPLLLGGQAVPVRALQIALESCELLAEARDECVRVRWFPAFRYALNASAERLDQGPGFARRRADLLLQEVFEAVAQEAPLVSTEEVRAYYEAHRHEFVKPERIRIFRILLASEKDATDLIAALPAVVSLEAWRALSRTRSLDQATHERGGDLGFVAPDGNTDVPEVRVDAGLYQAVLSLKEGEILRKPVPEGERFAVVWRRGSLAPSEQTLEQVSPSLSARLRHAHGEERVAELIGRLRSTELHDYAPLKIALYEEAQKSKLSSASASP